MFRRTAQWVGTLPSAQANTIAMRSLLMRSRYESNDIAGADSLLGGLLAERSQDPTLMTYAGLIAARRGNTTAAERVAADLCALDTPFLRGANTMGRARIVAVLGRKDEATRLAGQARAEGVLIANLHLLPELQLLRGYAPFEELIKPVG